jgi:hypothetical protein
MLSDINADREGLQARYCAVAHLDKNPEFVWTLKCYTRLQGGRGGASDIQNASDLLRVRRITSFSAVASFALSTDSTRKTLGTAAI